MATVNGFGTDYYGWKALPDGTAEATLWTVAAFFPVMPLCRRRFRILNTRDERAAFYVLIGWGFGTEMELVETLPLERRTVLKTYAKAYLLLPPLLVLPLAILFGALLTLDSLGYRQAVKSPVTMAIGGGACILYWGFLVAYILDGASGRRIGRSAGRSHVPPTEPTPPSSVQ